MLDRAKLKFKAKEVLRTNYWLSLAICIVINAVSQGIGSLTLNGKFFNTKIDILGLLENPDKLASLSPAVIIIISCLILLYICFDIFLITPLTVGEKRFFVFSAQSEGTFSTIGEVFKSSHYMNIVKVMFMKGLCLLLWSLFYIIPLALLVVFIKYTNSSSYILLLSLFGFIPYMIKFYSLFMVDYILSENPEINWHDAFSKSSEMMKECRFQTFLLQLSFIGWLYLGLLACVVGVFFILPYIEATMTQLYLEKKNQCNTYDFCYEN